MLLVKGIRLKFDLQRSLSFNSKSFVFGDTVVPFDKTPQMPHIFWSHEAKFNIALGTYLKMKWAVFMIKVIPDFSNITSASTIWYGNVIFVLLFILNIIILVIRFLFLINFNFYYHKLSIQNIFVQSVVNFYQIDAVDPICVHIFYKNCVITWCITIICTQKIRAAINS